MFAYEQKKTTKLKTPQPQKKDSIQRMTVHYGPKPPVDMNIPHPISINATMPMQFMFNPFGKDFLVGAAAESAIDNVIADEDPYWRIIVSGLSKRPAYVSGQVMAVWNAASPEPTTAGKQKVACASCGGDIEWKPRTSRIDIWDMGHKSGEEYQKSFKSLKEGEIRYEEFLADYQNPDKYQPEHPACNRSHAYEA